MKYLTGCADLFRDGYTDVCRFALAKTADRRWPARPLNAFGRLPPHVLQDNLSNSYSQENSD